MGNKILISICHKIGEAGLDQCPSYVKLLKLVFIETNYKLRIDGIMFLKNYFKTCDIKSLVETERFQYVYLPELLGYLEDGDPMLVCDAIITICPLIEFLEEEILTKYFVP